MVRLKITRFGDALGVDLPAELLAALNRHEGDALHLIETPTGYRIPPLDPELEQQLEVAREVMDENREVLRALSKL